MTTNTKPIPADVLLNGTGWSGQVESQQGEASTKVFAGLLMLPTSQSTQITISYILPPSVVQAEGSNVYRYALRVQVQPGLAGLPFRLEIKIPETTSVLNPEEGWQALDGQRWVWQGILDRTIRLRVQLQTNPVP